jgi:hypothetical protein
MDARARHETSGGGPVGDPAGLGDWRYFVLFETPATTRDDPFGLARLRSGDLIDYAEALTPDGTWRPSDALLRNYYKGEPETAEVDRSRAVDVATAWYAAGRREDIPDDLRDAPRP